MKIPFIKAHGAGNDFVIIDKNVDIIRKSKKIIKKLCDRRFGIGCDQLILLKQLGQYHQVFFYNSDGSLGKNCGNGLRCAYKYLTEIKKRKTLLLKARSFFITVKKLAKSITLTWARFLWIGKKFL
jgi:diaminopimelate epimerase